MTEAVGDGPGASEPASLGSPAWLPTRAPSGRPASGRRLRPEGEATVSRLVAAGREAFSKVGYGAARVDDVVALAGTSHGTFYLYFRNKEDLLHRLALECGTELGELTARLRELPADLPAGEFEAWVGAFFVAYRRHAPVVRVWLERRELDPLMQALANDTLGGLAGAFRDRLDPAVAAVVDPSVATLALLSLLGRMAAYVVAGDGTLDEARTVQTATRLARAALAHRDLPAR